MQTAGFALLAALLAALTLTGADAPRDDEKSELAGRWRPISIESDGRLKADIPKETWTFDRGRLTVTSHDQARAFHLEYIEKPAAEPKEFDWTRKPKPGKPPQPWEPGIYEIKDGKLTLCYSSSHPLVRPKKFETLAAKPPEPSFTMYVLEPVKD